MSDEDSDDIGDKPWISQKEDDQITKEFRYLNSIDRETGNWRDLEVIYFDPKVLDTYRKNNRCKVGNNFISFLGLGGDSDLEVNFDIYKGKLMVQSKYFCFVPPRERKHWENHQLPEDIETTDDNYLK